jgi:hypothetical protein
VHQFKQTAQFLFSFIGLFLLFSGKVVTEVGRHKLAAKAAQPFLNRHSTQQQVFAVTCIAISPTRFKQFRQSIKLALKAMNPMETLALMRLFIVMRLARSLFVFFRHWLYSKIQDSWSYMQDSRHSWRENAESFNR